MKLKFFLILIFSLVVLIPSLLFWAWPYSKALDSEIYEVKERHLVIAKNLAMALERYYQDLTSAFSVLSFHLGNNDEREEIDELMKVYNFHSVMLVAADTGLVLDCIKKNSAPHPHIIDKKIFETAKRFLVSGEPKITPVMQNKEFDNNSMLMVVMPMGKNIALGYLSTRYIVDLGKRVAFGQKGHSAILDQTGRVMAHPLTEWIRTQKNIATTSVVQKMMAGETGVDTFISPAFFNEMIAGYTAVPNAGWGVMVPQPIAELHKKAEAIDRMAMLVMLLGLGLALLIAIPVSFIITKPLERLTKATQAIGKKENFDTTVKISDSKLLPLEVRELNENFMGMMNQLSENRKSISRLAYIDINTGLPNRNSFQKLAHQALQKMVEDNTRGAMLFIDFDGFKQINDTYGHRAGDELLSLFAKQLMEHFSLKEGDESQNFILNNTTLPDVIPARLGGDEFIVLFKHIKNKADIKEKAEALLSAVFGEYELYGNIHISLNGSVGIALFPEHGSTYETLIKAADWAMYEAKNSENDTICFAS